MTDAVCRANDCHSLTHHGQSGTSSVDKNVSAPLWNHPLRSAAFTLCSAAARGRGWPRFAGARSRAHGSRVL